MLAALSYSLAQQRCRDKELPRPNVEYAQFLRSAKKNLAPAETHGNSGIFGEKRPNQAAAGQLSAYSRLAGLERGADRADRARMPGQSVISFFVMNSDKSASSGRGARVLSFRRGRAASSWRAQGQPPDLSKYERDDGPDDYRHRMIVNLAAFAFLVCLVGAGYWLADTMARQRKDQECVLSGRRACSPAIVEIQRIGRSAPRY